MNHRIENGGDDLGGIWYDFYGMTMSQAMEWVKRKGIDQYELIDIKVWKKYKWFGPLTRIHVLFEKNKIF